MSHFKNKLTVSFCLGIGFCLVIVLVSSKLISMYANTRSAYTYAFVTNSGIGFIDPTVPEKLFAWYNVMISDTKTLGSKISTSPDGNWIAVSIAQSGTHFTREIQLFNVAEGVAEPPIQVGNGFPSELDITGWDYMAPVQEMLWSPDSHYLAMNMINGTKADIYTYSTVNNTITDITGLDISQHYRIAWSTDSTHIVTSSLGCYGTGQCNSKMEIFDVQGRLANSIITLDVACDLGWSPDNRYVYFMTSCNVISLDSENLYLWDTIQNTSKEIVNFTNSVQPDPKAFPNAEYVVLWNNLDTLLVSAAFMDSNSGNAVTKTVSYSVSAHSLTAVNNDFIQQWAINPVSLQPVFHQITQADFDWSAPKGSTVHLVQISNKGLSELAFPQAAQIGSGCDLSWSPDGLYLAYSLSEGCTMDHPVGFGFMDNATGSVRQHHFAGDDQPPILDAFRAGWTVTPGNPTSNFTPPPPILQPSTPSKSGSSPTRTPLAGFKD